MRTLTSQCKQCDERFAHDYNDRLFFFHTTKTIAERNAGRAAIKHWEEKHPEELPQHPEVEGYECHMLWRITKAVAKDIIFSPLVLLYSMNYIIGAGLTAIGEAMQDIGPPSWLR